MKRGLGGRMGRRGQITLFIIMAIAIVALVVLLFLLMGKKTPQESLGDEFDPYMQIEKCYQDSIEEAEKIMMLQGGYLNPKLYRLYEDNKVAYLCYTEAFFKTCVNQEPLYLEHWKADLLNYSKQSVERCFENLKTEMEKKDYKVELGKGNYSLGIMPKKVTLDIKKKIVIQKDENKREIDSFQLSYTTPLYELQSIASEIVNGEAKSCYYDYTKFMLTNPDVAIEKKAVGGDRTSTKVYIIEDKITEKKLYIATKSCAFPAGL